MSRYSYAKHHFEEDLEDAEDRLEQLNVITPDNYVWGDSFTVSRVNDYIEDTGNLEREIKELKEQISNCERNEKRSKVTSKQKNVNHERSCEDIMEAQDKKIKDQEKLIINKRKLMKSLVKKAGIKNKFYEKSIGRDNIGYMIDLNDGVRIYMSCDKEEKLNSEGKIDDLRVCIFNADTSEEDCTFYPLGICSYDEDEFLYMFMEMYREIAHLPENKIKKCITAKRYETDYI